MVFKCAEWVGDFPFEPPANILVGEFLLKQSWPGQSEGAVQTGTLICPSTGTKVTTQQIGERVEALAASLCQRFGWKPNEGTPWDKVVGIFSLNAVCRPQST